MTQVKIEIDENQEHAMVLINCKPHALALGKIYLLDNDDEPMYDDAEDYIIHTITIDEDLVEEVVPQIAEAILPYIEQYLPKN